MIGLVASEDGAEEDDEATETSRTRIIGERAQTDWTGSSIRPNKNQNASRGGRGPMGGSAPAAVPLQSEVIERYELLERFQRSTAVPREHDRRRGFFDTELALQANEESLQYHEAVQPHQARVHD